MFSCGPIKEKASGPIGRRFHFLNWNHYFIAHLLKKVCGLLLIIHGRRRSESAREGGTLDLVSISAADAIKLHDMEHAYESFTRHSRRVGRG